MRKAKSRAQLIKEANHYKKKAEQYRDYSYELKSQLDKSIESLKNIGVGLVNKGLAAEWSYQTKLQASAANDVVTICSRYPRAPEGWFYL